MALHEGLGIVQEHDTRHSTEVAEGALHPREPRIPALVGEGADVDPPGESKGLDEEVDLCPLPPRW